MRLTSYFQLAALLCDIIVESVISRRPGIQLVKCMQTNKVETMSLK